MIKRKPGFSVIQKTKEKRVQRLRSVRVSDINKMYERFESDINKIIALYSK